MQENRQPHRLGNKAGTQQASIDDIRGKPIDNAMLMERLSAGIATLEEFLEDVTATAADLITKTIEARRLVAVEPEDLNKSLRRLAIIVDSSLSAHGHLIEYSSETDMFRV